jgi:glutaminase
MCGVRQAGLGNPRGEDTDPVTRYLADLRRELTGVESGEVATYIPELAKADPTHLAIVIATTDGRVFAVGEADVAFTIQSVSKPFAHGLALASQGREAVLRRVGVEPTGEAFNAIILDDVANRPFNPMVNAGAIAIVEFYPGRTITERAEAMRAGLSRFAGRALEIDQAVYRSESETGHRNRAIAYLMRNSEMIHGVPEEVLDLYFQQCSMLVTCRDLAIMAATLANDGIHPQTGEAALPQDVVQDVVTVMHSCGMYDFAGQWSYEIGMAAKSGVSGCVMAVVPGQVGIAAYSPRLDRHGNSVRGILACRQISADFGLHPFRSRSRVSTVLRRELDGSTIRSKRIRSATERSILDRDSSTIRIIEAQGPLYFGTAERLGHKVKAACADASHVIVDFRHVHRADPASVKLLRSLCSLSCASELRLFLSNLAEAGALASLRAALAEDGEASGCISFFETLDDALERAETELLARVLPPGGARDDETSALSEMVIFRGLEPEELELLVASIDPPLVQYGKGQVIFSEGEPALALFAIARGSVRVELPVTGVRPRAIRLASIGRTLTFGELAGVDGKPRAARVVAESDVACYAISFDALHAFGSTYPVIYAKILLNIIREISDTVRFSNEALRAFEY